MYCLARLCRICVTTNRNMKSLHSHDKDSITFLHKLLTCVPELKSENFGKDTLLCEKCCQKLHHLYAFRDLCTKNKDLFEGYIAQLKQGIFNREQGRLIINLEKVWLKPEDIQMLCGDKDSFIFDLSPADELRQENCVRVDEFNMETNISDDCLGNIEDLSRSSSEIMFFDFDFEDMDKDSPNTPHENSEEPLENTDGEIKIESGDTIVVDQFDSVQDAQELTELPNVTTNGHVNDVEMSLDMNSTLPHEMDPMNLGVHHPVHPTVIEPLSFEPSRLEDTIIIYAEPPSNTSPQILTAHAHPHPQMITDPVVIQPHKPVVMQPHKPVVMQPHKPVVMQPHKPVVMQPHKPMAMQPHKPMVIQPHKPMVVQPHKPVVMQAHKPMVMERSPMVVEQNPIVVENPIHAPTLVPEMATCNDCGKTYKDMNCLKRHRGLMHSGEKPLKCKFCEKQFRTTYRLQRHENTHLIVRPFKCETCNQGFTNAANLKRHMFLHSNQANFKCDICEEKFLSPVNLKNHMRIHNGQMSYECEVCHTVFNRMNDFKAHMRVHAGKKLHECNICKKNYSSSASVRRHKKEVHQVGAEPKPGEAAPNENATKESEIKVENKIDNKIETIVPPTEIAPPTETMASTTAALTTAALPTTTLPTPALPIAPPTAAAPIAADMNRIESPEAAIVTPAI